MHVDGARLDVRLRVPDGFEQMRPALHPPSPFDQQHEQLVFCGSQAEFLPCNHHSTSIAIDRQGYIYVGELKGCPAPSGESNVWRISPHANAAQCGMSPDCVKVFDGGFTSIIDLAVGPDGLLYVLELDEGSWAAVQIFGAPRGGTLNACSVKYGFCKQVEEGIPVPSAIAFEKDGTLWATRNTITPGGAEIFKVRSGKKLKWWWHPRHSSFGDR